MHILHLANGYAGSKVHSELFKRLDKIGVSQTVFVPCKHKSWIGLNLLDLPRTDIIYKIIYNPLHRYLYPLKRYTLLNSILKSVDVNKIDLVQAANLFSDGGVAYKLYQKYKIPYIAAVRDTDMQFLNKTPFSFIISKDILLNAKKIVFVSKSLEKRFVSNMKIQSIIPQIKKKFVFLNNGIDDYFLDNINRNKCENHNLLYVGRFVAYKNLPRLLTSIDILKRTYPDLQLTVVGGTGAKHDEFMSEINKRSKYVRFIGQITDKRELLDIYRQHSIFAMPSIGETFGLVYIEALTQNLSILYAKNSGVDGLFDNNLVCAVDPYDIDSIVNGLHRLLLSSINSTNCDINFEDFRWDNIAKKYLCLYHEILNEL